jgi:hypothetical protein
MQEIESAPVASNAAGTSLHLHIALHNPSPTPHFKHKPAQEQLTNSHKVNNVVFRTLRHPNPPPPPVALSSTKCHHNATFPSLSSTCCWCAPTFVQHNMMLCCQQQQRRAAYCSSTADAGFSASAVQPVSCSRQHAHTYHALVHTACTTAPDYTRAVDCTAHALRTTDDRSDTVLPGHRSLPKASEHATHAALLCSPSSVLTMQDDTLML